MIIMPLGSSFITARAPPNGLRPRPIRLGIGQEKEERQYAVLSLAAERKYQKTKGLHCRRMDARCSYFFLFPRCLFGLLIHEVAILLTFLLHVLLLSPLFAPSLL